MADVAKDNAAGGLDAEEDNVPITLRSKDNVAFELPKRYATLSNLVKTTLEQGVLLSRVDVCLTSVAHVESSQHQSIFAHSNFCIADACRF